MLWVDVVHFDWYGEQMSCPKPQPLSTLIFCNQCNFRLASKGQTSVGKSEPVVSCLMHVDMFCFVMDTGELLENPAYGCRPTPLALGNICSHSLTASTAVVHLSMPANGTYNGTASLAVFICFLLRTDQLGFFCFNQDLL